MTTIASPQNEKLKLVRKLRDRRHREREGLFASEGEDLVEAGLGAGLKPRFLLSAAGSGLAQRWGGDEVEPQLLDGVSSLGSGTRAIAVWPLRTSEQPAAPCLYLHGVSDPGNVGTIVRTADALLGTPVVLGPECADPFSPKAVRASMGSIFPGLRCGRASRRLPASAWPSSPTAAPGSRRWPGRRRSASAPSVRACRRTSSPGARSR